ncbi:hypothetical protein BH09ACT9_BH09ACT9_00080 [soil metagenome]
MTDHKALSESRSIVPLHFGVPFFKSDEERYTYAQVHATLALVEATEKVAEQARIRNLIAYKQLHTGREMRDTGRGGLEWVVDDLEVSGDGLTAAIEEGLGVS